MALTAAATGTFAATQTKFLMAKEREYSNPTKFKEPKYASVQDMEKVCYRPFVTFIDSLMYTGAKRMRVGDRRNQENM